MTVTSTVAPGGPPVTGFTIRRSAEVSSAAVCDGDTTSSQSLDELLQLPSITLRMRFAPGPLIALWSAPSPLPHDSSLLVGALQNVVTSSTSGFVSSDVPFAGLSTTGTTVSPGSFSIEHDVGVTLKRPDANCAAHAFAATSATRRASGRIASSVGWISGGTFLHPARSNATMISERDMTTIYTKALSLLAARLGVEPLEDGIDAVVDGVPVEIRFVMRSHGSSSSKWTEISVKSKHLKGFPMTFNFHVRPTEHGDAQDVRDGRTRDIVLGHAAFDEAFVVEAAPEEVVRRMLDATTRDHMLAEHPLRVISTPKNAILIERSDWVEDVDLLERLTKLTVRLAASIAPAAREAAAARRHHGAQERGYRDRAPTDEEIRAEWDLDVQRLAAQIERRRARAQKNGIVLALFLLIAVLAGAVFVASSR